MKQSIKKTLLIIATVLILINLGIFIVDKIVIFASGGVVDYIINTINSYLDQPIQDYFDFDLEVFKTYLAIGFYAGSIFSLAIRIGAGIVFAKRINLNATEFKSKKGGLIAWSIVAMIFDASFVAGALGLIVGLTESKEDFEQEGMQPETADNHGIIEKINTLKKLKDQGAITEEEYGKLLSEIIK